MLRKPSTLISIAIIAAVAAIVAVANYRENQRSAIRVYRPILKAQQDAGTSREALALRVTDLEARLAARPSDVALAVTLAETLVRQTRVTTPAQSMASW